MRRILDLGSVVGPDGRVRRRAIFRLVVPTAAQPDIAAQNPVPIAPVITTAAEVTAIAAGQIVEEVHRVPIPDPGDTATVQAALVAEYTKAQTRLTEALSGGGGAVVASWDGTAWT
jgi:hypothetical protein